MLKTIVCLLLALPIAVHADHKPESDWSWHLLAAGMDESRLSVYQRDCLFGIFNFDCDLTGIDDEAGEDAAAEGEADAEITLIKTDASPSGLLLVRCNLGAHSQQLSIIDLALPAAQPAFTVTGSYSASWEIQDGELWLGYDEPCDTGPSVECPDGYETIFVQYPVVDATAE